MNDNSPSPQPTDASNHAVGCASLIGVIIGLVAGIRGTFAGAASGLAYGGGIGALVGILMGVAAGWAATGTLPGGRLILRSVVSYVILACIIGAALGALFGSPDDRLTGWRFAINGSIAGWACAYAAISLYLVAAAAAKLDSGAPAPAEAGLPPDPDGLLPGAALCIRLGTAAGAAYYWLLVVPELGAWLGDTAWTRFSVIPFTFLGAGVGAALVMALGLQREQPLSQEASEGTGGGSHQSSPPIGLSPPSMRTAVEDVAWNESWRGTPTGRADRLPWVLAALIIVIAFVFLALPRLAEQH